MTTSFQVTKPIKLPNTKHCSSLVFQHDFNPTKDVAPVLANYNPPPSNCQSEDFSKIVLELKATYDGGQLERIFGVWLGGVELLRSSAPQAGATGVTWTVEKDITKYSSLLKSPQTLAVYLLHRLDGTIPGIYHVDITFHLYPAEQPPSPPSSGITSPADLILPISRNLPLNDGLWFSVKNSIDIQSKQFKIPQNAYRAVLEVYVSFHNSDEFWYTHSSNEFIIANNLTAYWPGNGPFREVVVSLDGDEMGAVWPFTVIYNAGLNPSLWTPITGIGSFDLPSYDIEVTPFLGKLLDGKQHEFGFRVTNALDEWFIDANLHIWLDHKSKKTSGKLINHEIPRPTISSASKFKGFEGSFVTNVFRSISSSGWVKSSHGKITTHSFQDFNFTNLMKILKDGNSMILNQTIDENNRVYAMLPSYLYSVERYANVSLGFNEQIARGSSSTDFAISTLTNTQNGQSVMFDKRFEVIGGIGSTQQVYSYYGPDECYFWNVSSTDNTILYNITGDSCLQGSQDSSSGLEHGRWKPFPVQSASLESDLVE
ncbi:Peptide-N4-(N-acetyl-beta-glucosaminyl)asparagine amidase A [Macleaya cordata]|uniref:Peptide-N4-(N-acetyl-beta-glucosaminyl)asparagine amidase A n=1 Tax=Macleaya cordata TaxID=56857 RepID=A0A200QT39_MACCD|nr:Peptide-N4-(N-acetyl-beta-glucosaminyl)asparagine amidase A [Macleaya cordata]